MTFQFAKTAVALCIFLASNNVQALTSSTNEIFVVNWDGCVANTVPWRIRTGLDAALKVWPDDLPINDDAVDWDDKEHEWLLNKMSALSHVFSSPNDQTSVTCEYTLAGRMLLEEQELDDGNSVGKQGKYSRKFHPQPSDGPKPRRPGPTQSSRPLTVGEVAANWAEGAMIRDTVQVKYHCNKKDPLPAIQEALSKLLAARGYDIPIIDPEVADALDFCSGKIVMTVGHSSELQVARKTLEKAGLQCKVIEDSDIEAAIKSTDESQIHLLVKEKKMVMQTVQCAPPDSTIFVVDSSWYNLQKEIPIFGDNMPRNGVGTALGNRKLSLCLAEWAENTHPTIHSAATMNPWTRLIPLQEFSELASARII